MNSLLVKVFLVVCSDAMGQTQARGEFLSLSRPVQELHSSFASTDGTYVLQVLYHDALGLRRFGAYYRMLGPSGVVWAAELPYSVNDAQVSNRGELVGFAHRVNYAEHNPGGLSNERHYLEVIVLDTSGREILKESHEQTDEVFCYPPCPLSPSAKLIRADWASDRFFMVVYDTSMSTPTIWTYQISSGKKLKSVLLTELRNYIATREDVVDMHPIGDTSLLLIHSIFVNKPDNRMGAIFKIVDQEFKTRWQLEIPEDYTETQLRSQSLGRSLRAKHLVRCADRQFEIFSITSERKRVFELKQADGQNWRVAEVETPDKE